MAHDRSDASTGEAVSQVQDQAALELTDRRTGARYELEISDGTIGSQDLRQIKTTADDFGLMAFDPGLLNTAICRSAITLVDGERGILEYRGYPIEQLSERSSFLEVAYLLAYEELPDRERLREFEQFIASSYDVPTAVLESVRDLPRDAHPMSLLISMVSLLGTYDPGARRPMSAQALQELMLRLIPQVAVMAAAAYRHNIGKPFVPPDPSLSLAGNVLAMFFTEPGQTYTIDPTIERALDVLFIMHADHEQNCSTNVLKNIASSGADPYSAVSGALGALSGPSHGAANEAVLNMLRQIGSVDRVPSFIADVKAGKGRLMGFGHRVYKTYDPRARLVKQSADGVFAITGVNPRLEIALELERIGLEDEYFVRRRLYPNVDFYSGIIYEALGLPSGMFPVMFAIARTAGWVAHMLEFEQDPERKIVRPRQVFVGPARRDLPAT
jgi:citrate synthase